MERIHAAIIFIVFCAVFVRAQAVADEDDNQFWNDVQLTVPLDEKFDFTVWGTFRFAKNVSRLNDRRVAAGFVYKPSKSWSLQPFYWHIVARNARGEFLTEHRFNLRVGYRFPFRNFGLAHRSWFERRVRQPQNSWRYRPSLTFEKGIEKFIPGAKIFVTEEVFYDSIIKKFSRNRSSVGITKTLSKNLALDVFYTRQNDGYTRPGDLNIVGTNWKIKF